MNIYELDEQTPQQLRDTLGWAYRADAENMLIEVVMALCLKVQNLEDQANALRKRIKALDLYGS